MPITGLKQSASKEEFTKALGLNTLHNPNDVAVLKEMWEEVTNYWNKHFETTTSRAILKPEYATNDKIQRPYKWAHLEPSGIDAAIAAIWSTGKPGPRRYYDQGHSEDRRVYNWVLKWLLWHVCRYRDWRNRKSKATPGTPRPATSTTVVTQVAGRKRRASASGLLDNSPELTSKSGPESKRRRPIMHLSRSSIEM